MSLHLGYPQFILINITLFLLYLFNMALPFSGGVYIIIWKLEWLTMGTIILHIAAGSYYILFKNPSDGHCATWTLDSFCLRVLSNFPFPLQWMAGRYIEFVRYINIFFISDTIQGNIAHIDTQWLKRAHLKIQRRIQTEQLRRECTIQFVLNRWQALYEDL